MEEVALGSMVRGYPMSRRQAISFAVFCLMGGSGWLVESSLPTTLPVFEQASLHYFVITLAMLVLSVFWRTPLKLKAFPGIRLALAGLILLGFPALLNEEAHAATPETRAALFALVPLFVIVGVASLGRDSAGETRGRMLMTPALIGFSGALLVLPFRFPLAAAGFVSFSLVLLAVLSTAVGSVWIASLLRGCDIVAATGIVCAVNALALAIVAFGHGSVIPLRGELLTELLRAVLFDLPLLVLLVWLLRELPPAWSATRFLLIPLVSVIEGTALLRAPIGLRVGFGMLLIVAGSAAILFWRGSGDEDRATILKLN